jgi:hypothetical protein
MNTQNTTPKTHNFATQLEVEVFTINLLNHYVNNAVQHERNGIEKFLGIDSLKKDQTLTKKHDFEKFPESIATHPNGVYVHIHCWRSSSTNSHWLHCKICVNADVNGITKVNYSEHQTCIARIEGNAFTELYDFEPERTDYDVAKILLLNNQILSFEKSIKALKKDIPKTLEKYLPYIVR